jgi:hypothetical protein
MLEYSRPKICLKGLRPNALSFIISELNRGRSLQPGFLSGRLQRQSAYNSFKYNSKEKKL